MVYLTLDSSLGENLGGLLEGGGRQEGFGAQRCLGDTKEQRSSVSEGQAGFACGDALFNSLVLGIQLGQIHSGAGKQVGASCVLDDNLAGHLTGDNLDVLIVDVDVLGTVYLLYFEKDIFVYLIDTVDAENIGGGTVALGQFLTGTNVLTVGDENAHTEGNLISDFLAAFICLHRDSAQTLAVLDGSHTGLLGNDSGLLGLSCLEEFLNSGKTLGNIGTCHTTGMEGTHRQLSTGLTDGLSSDDTDGFADIHGSGVCQIGTVAVCADAVACAALEDGTDENGFNTGIHDSSSLLLVDHGIVFHENLAGFGMNHVADHVTAHQTVLQRLDYLVAVLDRVNDQTLLGAAILFADDDFLSNVNQTSGQISGVCGLQSGIGQGLTSTTCCNEVLQDVQALTEVGLDRDFHGLTGGSEHQASHTGQLTHLRDVTTGTGVTHHLDGVITVEVVLQSSDNVVGGLFPNTDNVLVTLLFGEFTALEVLGNRLNLLFGGGN